VDLVAAVAVQTVLFLLAGQERRDKEILGLVELAAQTQITAVAVVVVQEPQVLGA
jgi:hypothetical protein